MRKARELFPRQPVEAGPALLALRRLGEIAGDRRPSGKVRMGKEKRLLPAVIGMAANRTPRSI